MSAEPLPPLPPPEADPSKALPPPDVYDDPDHSQDPGDQFRGFVIQSVRTPAEAVTWAHGQVYDRERDWLGLCQMFSRRSYNVAARDETAALGWARAQFRHTDGSTPPAGAICYWTGGSEGSGHACVSTGQGNVISTDILRRGWPDHVTLAMIIDAWGRTLTYVGWTEDINGVHALTGFDPEDPGGEIPVPPPPAPPTTGDDMATLINTSGGPAKYMLIGGNLIHIRPYAQMTGTQVVDLWKRAAGAGLTEVAFNRTQIAGVIANLRSSSPERAACTCPALCQMTGG